MSDRKSASDVAEEHRPTTDEPNPWPAPSNGKKTASGADSFMAGNELVEFRDWYCRIVESDWMDEIFECVYTGFIIHAVVKMNCKSKKSVCISM